MAAFAGLVNGLCQAHIIGVVWGGFLAKYMLAVGIFILALGLGSLIPIRKNYLQHALIYQQMSAAVLGIFGPWIILYAGTQFPLPISGIIAALSIFVLGFVGGMEFPLISELTRLDSDSSFSFANLMSFDYAGMSLATLLFPLFLLRLFGVFPASIIACAINLIVAAEILYYFKDQIIPKKIIVGLIALFGVGLLVFITVSGSLEELAGKWITS
ncbi:MAG: hypothetical protein V4736_10285 [Bdellovibrionota bacterium]